jgi:Zn-dependent protease/CBS domain-containing protein
MAWSFRIARVSGIDIRVHATFTLIVLLGAFEFGMKGGARGAAFGALLVCCLFGCIVLHELGHSLVAQRFGVKVREIVLLPIGGVARLMRDPSKPWHEFLIAIAGPLVNVLIAAVLAAVAFFAFGPGWLFGVLGGVAGDPAGGSVYGQPSAPGLLAWLLTGNLIVAVFNMIPALPMDGGRVFRSLLAMLLGRPRATRIASIVGQVLAAGLVVLGLHQNLMLALVGGFVFLGAAQERFASEATESLAGLKASDACSPNALVLSPGDPIGAALELMLRSPQTYFAVVHGDRIIGALTREDAVRGARRAGPMAYVAGAMQRELGEVDAATPLAELRATLIEHGGRPVAVRGGNGYLGLLGLDDISRVSTLATALRRGGIVARREEPQSGVV